MKDNMTAEEHAADIVSKLRDEKSSTLSEQKEAPAGTAGARVCSNNSNVQEKKEKVKYETHNDAQKSEPKNHLPVHQDEQPEQLNKDTLNNTFKFPIAVNSSVKGAGKPDFSDSQVRYDLTYVFEEKTVTVFELAEILRESGNISAHCVNEKGEFHRKAEYFKFSHFIAIDIDNDGVDEAGNKIRRKEGYLSFNDALRDDLINSLACIVYETHSSTSDWNRFRIVFILKEAIDAPILYRKIVKSLIRKFGGDEACSDPSRVFFGAKHGGRVEVVGSPIFITQIKPYCNFEEEKSQEISTNAAPVKLFSETAENLSWKSTVLERAQKVICDSRRGNRHNARRKAAYYLGGAIASQILTIEEAMEGIEEAVNENTDDPEKAWKTINECMEAGQLKPLDLRQFTSSKNGKKGGRKQISIIDLVMKFREENAAEPLLFFRGEWYKFNGRYYTNLSKEDAVALFVAFLQKEMGKEKVSVGFKNDFLLNLKAEGLAYIPSDSHVPCWLEGRVQGGNIISMKNGLLDLDKFCSNAPYEEYFFSHSQDLFITSGCSFDYDPAADCPQWKKFISEVQPTEEGQNFLQLVFALSFLCSCKYEVMIYFYGPAGTGKSVTLYILEHLHGKDAVCCVPLSRFHERFALHLLTTHSLNIVGDLPTASDFSSIGKIEGALKDIVSGSLVDCEKKGQDLYTARARALNVFASNSLAVFTDRSKGIWDRLRIAPFLQVFRGTENQNNHLKEDLVRNELPGIFKWALDGLLKLNNLNYFPEHPEGAKIKEKHALDCDHERRFLEEHTEAATGGRVLSSSLYKAFCQWIDGNGYRKCGEAKFGDSVKRVYPEAFKERESNGGGKRLWYWKNIVYKG